MHDDKYIFLSYSSKDIEFVRRLRNDLVENGFNAWMDKTHIPGGHHWDDTVEEALENSELLILLISPNSVKSSFVRDEMDYALDKAHPIPQIPVMYKKTKLPLTWRRLQYIELNEKNYQKNFPVLVQQIKAHLGKDKVTQKEEEDISDLPHEKRYLNLLVVALLIVSGVIFYLFLQKNSIVKYVSDMPESNTTHNITDNNNATKSEVKVVQVTPKKHTEVVAEHTNVVATPPIKTVEKTTKVPERASVKTISSKVIKKYKEIDTEDINVVPAPSAETIGKPKKIPKEDFETTIVSKKKTSSHSHKSEKPVKHKIVHTPVQKIIPQKPKPMKPKGRDINVNVFKNIPYDANGIVLSFVEKLNRNEPVKLQVVGYSKKGVITEKARDRVRNIVELLKKRGLKRSDIETKIVFNSTKDKDIEYNIVEE